MRATRGARQVVVGGAAVLAMLLVGCGDDTSESGDASTTSAAGDGAGQLGNGSTTDDAAGTGDGASDGATDLAQWQMIEVTDTGGETFSMADLQGRPVLVENMATWCSNCASQLEKTQEAAERAGEDAVVIALSVETDLDVATLADYQEKNGFTNIRFAVMSPEMLAAMDDAFGTTALNPPSTPKVVISADGVPGELTTGGASPDEILATLGLA